MSDIVRDFISESSVAITDEEIIQRRKNRSLAFAALDAERAEHAGHIVDLEQHIKALDIRWDKREYAKEVADLKKELTRVSCMHSDAHAKVINSEKQVADLHQQVYEIKKVYNALCGPRAHQLGCDCGGQNRSGYTCKQFYDLMKKD